MWLLTTLCGGRLGGIREQSARIPTLLHTSSRPPQPHQRRFGSRHLTKLDNGQVSSAVHIVHHKRQLGPTSASDRRLRRRTRTRGRPVPARFKSGPGVCGSNTGVNFPRRPSAERQTGAVLIIPLCVASELTSHRTDLQRISNTSRALVLH